MATTAQGNERMMEEGTNGPGRWWNILRIVGWSLAALMLLFPVVAMQFTDEVNWGPEDFLFAPSCSVGRACSSNWSFADRTTMPIVRVLCWRSRPRSC
ncbi:MAG: hypothetical protein IPI07_16005 [Flavobacteriales bacterium]|nr:hypothetical protein [Flavobacteriales bacterium]